MVCVVGSMEIKELGHVVLYVTNLELVGSFYRDVLGFHVAAFQQGMMAFSGGRTHHELLLIEVGGEKQKRGVKPGLYHIGFKIGTTKEELKGAITTLERKGKPIAGFADHYVTNSVYTMDPDGNEVELYVDVSDEWKYDPSVIMRPTRKLTF